MEQKNDALRPEIPKGRSLISRLIRAPRETVYRAFTEADAVAKWLVPDNMRAEVNQFDAREGGSISMSLIYLDNTHSVSGKTSADRDCFTGRFVELRPDEKIVEVIQFDSTDPRFAGEMKMTVSLTDELAGTRVTLLFEDIPSGIRPEDNNEGSRQSLKKLAALLENNEYS